VASQSQSQRRKRPAEETATGVAHIEPVLGYAVPLNEGVLLFDTGIATGPADLEAHYRPARREFRAAMKMAGIDHSAVRMIVNSHLHFDHCGGNPEVAGIPIVVQRTELAAARTAPDNTLADAIDFPGVAYDEIDGEAEVADGVFVVPTLATQRAISRWW
jgi:N-acyl homoserine lactone hydrolase